MIREIEIQLITDNRNTVDIILVAESDDETALIEIDDLEASENCEARVQLKEGYSYEYKIKTAEFRFDESPGLIIPSKLTDSTGRIFPGMFVGTLPLIIKSVVDSNDSAVLYLEVRTVKSNYRQDYRLMLEEITGSCTDLLMQHSSPAIHNFTADYGIDSSTLYQRFAFIKSVLDSQEFNESIMKILSSPVTAWKHSVEETNIRRTRRIGNSQIKQLAFRSNRLQVPEDHILSYKFQTIPSSISVQKKIETSDTHENRFVKYALKVFRGFCSQVRIKSKKKDNKIHRIYREALQLEEKLNSILNHGMFRDISDPVSIPLNSPVLQRREGYRELLRTWLMFDLAAKLVWRGGEDVYAAGKRDVAVLYEYWVFFKLLKILSEIYSIDHESIDKLIEKTDDGLGLKLRSGKYIALYGTFSTHGRKLCVQFSYNRTFLGGRDYPEAGSWSRSMRPDYTLSIWPSTFTNKDHAEKEELITHIHFDAKYRIDNIKEIIGGAEESEDELSYEKKQQIEGTYKHADLLKMHAYKDAIRRTAGAYVLYPGSDQTARMKGFHEIIPGLGAFAVRPVADDNGTEELKSFIKNVTLHLCDRATQHERHSYYTFCIHKKPNDFTISEVLPETFNNSRVKPPADTFVLVGYCKNVLHYNWITEKKKYNARISGGRGSLNINSEISSPDFILLHSSGEILTGDIWRVNKNSCIVMSKHDLLMLSYPDPGHDNYLVYEIEKPDREEFRNLKWDISRLDYYSRGRASALPFAVSLKELMKVVCPVRKNY
ncbi:MAG: DUF2357 domain-containing protein [Melioribacteraceae bacterium]|nr:DUF2357 domain-containing protein [Melioribacteraceae bacterium]